MSSEKIKDWTAKRGQAKGSITRITSFVEGLNKDTRTNEASSRLELLERAFNDFKEADSRLLALECVSEIIDIESKYLNLKVKLSEFISSRVSTTTSVIDEFNKIIASTTAQQNEFLTNFTNTLSTSLNQSILNQSSEEPHFAARLPRLQVPTFSGDYKEFHSFKDLFTASVHTKSYLADVEKFQYLRSCLKGEPAELIRHFSISDANYKAAWSKICDRYDKKHIAISHFIRTFLDLQPIRQSSANKLRNLHNIADQVIRGLQAMGPEAESRDHWLLHILLMKTDTETQQAWALSSSSKSSPTFEEFLHFINNRCDGLEPCESIEPQSKSSYYVNSYIVSANQGYPRPMRPCPLCNQPHRLFECDKFKGLESKNKRSEVLKLNACFNCLSTLHRVNRCQSQRSCQKCGRRHHSMLHDGVASRVISNVQSVKVTQEAIQLPPSNNGATSNVTSLHIPTHINKDACQSEQVKPEGSSAKINLAQSGYAILPTAVVLTQNRYGRSHECNALLDSGSQISFISDSYAKSLQLPRQRANIVVGGLATSNTITKGKTTITIRSKYDSSIEIRLTTFIVDHITTTSQYKQDNIKAPQFDGIQLADPTYYDKKTIDILIGADQFFNILKIGKRITSPHLPIAQETIFGWVISGHSQATEIDETGTICDIHIAVQTEVNLDSTLKRFWELEEITTTNVWNEDEHKCERQFKTTTKRNDSGRFIVQLPFKDCVPSLGDTLTAAKCRLLAMERKIETNAIFGKMYREFMEEYESLGHMVKLSSKELNIARDGVCYLPHHGVWKHNSETTKLRVVFDGSCQSSTGTSLNDNLLIGPTVQPTLWTVLLRFRRFPIALSADIEKIALLLVAEETEQTFPAVSKIIKQNFYVDDLLTGANDVAEATQLKTDLLSILQSYGFPLRKWKSNVHHLGDHFQSISLSDQHNFTQVLGLLWDPAKDVFYFNVNIPNENVRTKRGILSVISRIYDPLGWLSPFIIKTKLMMQHLWLAKVSWDEEISEELQDRWLDIKHEFKTIEKIRIPRCIGPNLINIEIHGFSDASELAYAACVYFRIKSNNDQITTNLVTSKNKVAPIQVISLPRLELCGAHLLAKLITNVCRAFEFTDTPICLWTDSTVVLSWLQSGPPKKWKNYVANRTSEIHKLVPNAIWRHVSGKNNPADLSTRGINVSQVLSNELWWKGPNWLFTPDEPWPKQFPVNETNQERRLNVISLQLSTNKDTSIIDEMINKTASWSKLVRILSIMLRFTFNIRNATVKKSGWLSIEELNEAETTIIKHIQQEAFYHEISTLRENKQLKANSPLLALTPFIDHIGLLRVGGRLENATCSYATKHPLIIPKNHKLATMILNYLHRKHLHPGPALIVSLSRMKYWILGVRKIARTVSQKCVACLRYSRHTSSQLMGNLPSERVIPSRPFSKTGVDYAGPIMLASKRGRGSRLIKGYIVIFVCLCTKALHIEAACDMTTTTFMGALRRFTARRGVPNQILSDNGSNFRGTNHLLTDLFRMFQSDEYNYAAQQYALDNQIKWSFISPLSPNFGGIWERAVRSIKAHLVRVVGNSHLTFEEMSTVLAQIECILNSRPLCLINNEDPTNIDALTPAHFLTMGTSALIPDTNYTEITASRLTRWQHVQQLVQSYWKKISRDYLHTLQQRTSAKFKTRNIQINDIVLVKEGNNPPGIWPMGKVIDIHPGADGMHRKSSYS